MRRFLPAVLVVVLFTLGAPYLARARDYLFEELGAWGMGAVAAALAAVAVGVAVAALAKIRDHRPIRYAGLLLVAVLLWLQSVAFETALADVNLAEKIHIVQYGLLAWLLYRAFLPAGDWTVLALPLLWVTIAGCLEEGLQWWLESRVGEARDVALNVAAGATGLLLSVVLEPPGKLAWRLPAASRRRVVDTLALAALCAGLFVHFVHLGYEIEDPRIGRFRSWHSPQELAAAAAERDRQWSVRPRPKRRPSAWRREDRFQTEAGWHVMHRNQSYRVGNVFLARQANLILETYYRPFLDHRKPRRAAGTSHRWPPHVVQDVAARMPEPEPHSYSSPVLRERIWLWPPKPLFLPVWLPLVAALWAAGRWWLRQ